MSLLYGVWRPLPCPQTIEDRDYFAAKFHDWKCDYVGAAQLGPVAFGSRVFRIYPESKAEVQPLKEERDELLLIADCRLDNREELASGLRLDNITLRQTPDSSLILQAYQRWGKDCFQRLEGDFAIAIWDHRTQELILARDVMGVRPLAYAHWNDGFAFCSSIPELYHLPAVPAALDDIKMAALFVGHPTGRERTPFEAVTWVHPGKIITFREGQIVKETFAAIAPIELSKEDQKNPAPRLGHLLKESVKKRIRGDGDIVCELSGGFDSGSITAIAATLLKGTQRQVRAISWAPDPKEFPIMDGPDERKQIQWMEKRYGVKCSYFPYWKGNENLNTLAFQCYFHFHARPEIGKAKTVLSGWGGDEAVSFYLRQRHPQALLWDGIGTALARIRDELGKLHTAIRIPVKLARALLALWQQERLRQNRALLVDSRLTEPWRQSLSAAHGLEISKDSFSDSTHECMITLLTRGHIQDRTAFEFQDTKRLAKEMAYPMLDEKLVSFVTSLPAKHFGYGDKRRTLLRNALKESSVHIAPNTTKRDDAYSRASCAGIPNPSCSQTLTDELRKLHSRYFGIPLQTDLSDMIARYRHVNALSILALTHEKARENFEL